MSYGDEMEDRTGKDYRPKVAVSDDSFRAAIARQRAASHGFEDMELPQSELDLSPDSPFATLQEQAARRERANQFDRNFHPDAKRAPWDKR